MYIRFREPTGFGCDLHDGVCLAWALMPSIASCLSFWAPVAVVAAAVAFALPSLTWWPSENLSQRLYIRRKCLVKAVCHEMVDEGILAQSRMNELNELRKNVKSPK